jgi:hypothetical protein
LTLLLSLLFALAFVDLAVTIADVDTDVADNFDLADVAATDITHVADVC